MLEMTYKAFISYSHAVGHQHANSQRRVAEEEKERAEFQARNSASRELASASVAQLEHDPELSVILALHAVAQTYTFRHTTTREAADALQQSLSTSRLRWTLPHGSHVKFTGWMELSWLEGNGRVMRVSLQPNATPVVRC